MVDQRLAPIAMEGRGVLARYFPGEEELTLWSSTQIPHLMRTQVALMIGLGEHKLRVITPEVGGGFGSKLNVYAEEALLSWISMRSEEHTSELQSHLNLVCRLLLEKKKTLIGRMACTQIRIAPAEVVSALTITAAAALRLSAQLCAVTRRDKHTSAVRHLLCYQNTI